MTSDCKAQPSNTSVRAQAGKSAWPAVLIVLVMLMTLCLPVFAETVTYNYRNSGGTVLKNYIATGWSTSTLTCTNVSGRVSVSTATLTLVTKGTDGLNADLANPGGYYELREMHPWDPGYCSTDLVCNCSVISGGKGATGELGQGWTNAWNRTDSCTPYSMGLIRLDAGSKACQVQFTYKSGTISETPYKRWYINNMSLISTTVPMYNLTVSTNNSSMGTAVVDHNYTQFTNGEYVTATATPTGSYYFKNWTLAGKVISSNPTFTFPMPAQDSVLTANFSATQPYTVTTGVNPASTGTVDGGFQYGNGDPCTLTATPAPGYRFVKWTSDQGGSTTLSTANPYTFTVTGNTTVYAQFTVNNYNLTTQPGTNGGGTVSGTSGALSVSTPCTVVAAPNSGYDFRCWATDPAGTNIVSTLLTYSFSMPASNVTLYAIFVPTAKVAFFEGFETYAVGSLDKNTAGTTYTFPNAAPNGSGNPWFGPAPPNGYVDTNCKHSGLYGERASANTPSDRNYMNLAYRLNNGASFSGNVYLDWWFYENPTTASATTFQDTVELCCYTGSPITTDYGTLDPTGDVQHLALGGSSSQSGGFDSTKYQVRIINAATAADGTAAYDTTNGWFNIPGVTRDNAWHHARLVVGPRTADRRNNVDVYLDDMTAPRMSATTTVAADPGFNLLRLNNCTGASANWRAYYDDISFGTLPAALSLAVAPNPVAPGTPAVVTWSGIGADHFLAQLDNGSWSQRTSPYSIDTTGMAYGSVHTVSVKAVDAGGNEGAVATTSFVVNGVVSNLTVAPTSTTPGTPVTATWQSSGMDHFLLQVDAGTWMVQGGLSSVIDTTNLAYGSHTVSVKAVDAGGHEGPVAQAAFTLDRSIVNWSILGHYLFDSSPAVLAGSARFSTDFFAPATTESLAGAKTGLTYATSVTPSPNAGWTPYTSPTPIVDLNVVYGTPTTYTQYGVSYLCTYVINNGPAIPAAYFTCGSDDGNKVFVNGVAQTLVSSLGNTDAGTIGHDVYRGYYPNQDLYGPFALKSGGNKLLVKLTQGVQGYQLQGELCNSDRSELAAVRNGQISYVVSDDTPPTCSISINGGAPTAHSLNATLSLTASDDLNPVVSMSFSNDGYTWSTPVPFAASTAWLLSDGSGAKTVYAKFVDSCGNESVVSDDITVPSGWSVMAIGCDTAAGNPTGAGMYNSGASVTLSANTLPGYSFVGWSDANTGCLQPGQTGPVVSRNPSYTFTCNGDMFLFANYAINSYTVTASACTGGTTAGGGSYQFNSPVTVTATPDSTHTFVNWTTDACGGTAVASTDASYTFTLPANNVRLYANFAYKPVLTLASVPSSGGTTTGGGVRYAAGSICPITATPNAGYNLVGWSTDAAGLNVVETAPLPDYTMPATDTTLYAQFAVATTVFSDGFETWTANDSTNPLAQLDGQGWWETDFGCVNYAPDQKVVTTINGIMPHGGNQMATGWAASDVDACFVNLPTRLGGGANLMGNFQVDWWFYDPNGATDGGTYTDEMCISRLTPIPVVAGTYTYAQRVSVGAVGAVRAAARPADQAGADFTKYQVRIMGYGTADGAFNSDSWFNTPIARTVGWHHGTITVGPKLTDNTNLLGIYIDGAEALQKNSRTTGGFDMLEMLSQFSAAVGAFDDISISLSELPAVSALAVTPSIVTDAAPVSVSWTANYADHSLVQLDGGTWTDPATSPCAIDTTSLAYGVHTIAVKCVNSIGQMSPVTTATFRVDRSSIRTWNIIGHYAWEQLTTVGSTRWAKDFFDAPGISEPTMCAKTGASYATSVTPNPRISWAPYISPTPIVDLNLVYSTPLSWTEYGVSYLFTYVVNNGPAIPNAFVSCGSDDGIKVWFNGAYQGGIDAYRGCAQDSDIYPATGGFTINPGGNRLMIKISQGTSGYLGQARLCAYDGTTKTDPSWLSQLTYVASDDAAPTGTIQINGGASSTSSANVTLTLTATDDLSGVASMQFSNDGATYTNPVAFAATTPYTLSAVDGAKTVYVKFIDGAGNISAPVSATITLSTGPQAPPACTEKVKISDLWPLANDATVYGLDNANAKTVTAVWSDGFWIEETNRYAGIKVAVTGGTYKYFDDGTKSAVQVGDVVDVYGNLSVAAGSDRVFNASYVRDRTVGVGTKIPALGVTQRYIVGKQASANTPGLPSGKGIYSAGLFVKLAGSVLTPGANSFFLDDKTYAAGTGIQVFCGALPVPASGNKVVTGVVGMAGGLPVIYATDIR